MCELDGASALLFRWEGQLQRADEAHLIVKTTPGMLEELVETVNRHHSYLIPEIIALPVAGGSSEYLSWRAAQVRPQP